MIKYVYSISQNNNSPIFNNRWLYTLNLNQLKIFYIAVKRGNLSAAAKELYITQPAVTKAIQRLQGQYEVKFVNRFGKKLALTDAGRVLYAIAATFGNKKGDIFGSIQVKHLAHITFPQ
jgi:hypothetical protein